ncbi:hypothetical protein GCM10010964_43450 [Caldovatus sediminis]|uniref:Uncharacterized protein n=1 Tax=Caldovatus sediminis TaxID=2041189 RepID=A0A8J2ZFU3_9PROT|nr:hypothetical protein [Caldovatus sediminis]GGG51560.1 hypothetical protein GCM10010964_43450 [Caldovatus sediminis]
MTDTLRILESIAAQIPEEERVARAILRTAVAMLAGVLEPEQGGRRPGQRRWTPEQRAAQAERMRGLSALARAQQTAPAPPAETPRGRRRWSPEQREAARQRMRALNAARAARPVAPADSERAVEEEAREMARAGKSAREIAAALAIPLGRASELVLVSRAEPR